MAERVPLSFSRKRARQQLGLGTTYLPGPLPTDPVIAAHVSHVLTHGYCILPSQYPLAEVEAAKSELLRLEVIDSGPASKGGRSTFEGPKTKRVYGLADKSRVFDKFALNETVLKLNDYFLEENFLLSSFQTINLGPGAEAQPLHTDDELVDLPRPRPLMGTTTIIALDDFTAFNGSTVIIPGSHLWADSRRPLRSETHPVIMPAGSILYTINTLWHSAGHNATDMERKIVAVQYCQGWIRQSENMMVTVGWEDLDSIPERLRSMLGYKTHLFAGYVDGRSPRAGVEIKKQRLVEWARRGMVEENRKGKESRL